MKVKAIISVINKIGDKVKLVRKFNRHSEMPRVCTVSLVVVAASTEWIG